MKFGLLVKLLMGNQAMVVIFIIVCLFVKKEKIGALITLQKIPLNISKINNIKFEKIAIYDTFVSGLSCKKNNIRVQFFHFFKLIIKIFFFLLLLFYYSNIFLFGLFNICFLSKDFFFTFITVCCFLFSFLNYLFCLLKG